MNRDEVWELIRNDRDTVYGEPMLHAFLRTTDHLERRHWDTLGSPERKLLDPEIRLQLAKDGVEAERAIRDGAKNLYRALERAAEEGNLGLCRFIITKKPTQGMLDRSLEGAAAFGQREACEILIDAGANDFRHALGTAATSGRIELYKWLVSKGGRAGSGLMNAAAMGDAELCRWIVDQGDAWNEDLDDALKVAAREGHLELCKWLYRKGADPRGKALQRAAAGGHTEVCHWLLSVGATGLNEALAAAARNGHLLVCRWLLDNGADDLDNALWNAADRGRLEVCKFLVEKGAGKLEDALEVASNSSVSRYLSDKIRERG